MVTITCHHFSFTLLPNQFLFEGSTIKKEHIMRYALYIDVPRDNKTQSKKDRLLWQPLLWTIIPLRNCFPAESLPIHNTV